MSTSKLRTRLVAAAEAQELVRITRTIRRADPLEGCLLGVGRRWLLLHRASHEMFLNGYIAVRVADVDEIGPWGPGGFPARALRHFGEVAKPPARSLDLGSLRVLLEGIAAISPLVTIHIEKKDPTICFIGKPIGCDSKALALHEITPAAKWESALTWWPLRRITRVEFGGRYEQALHAVGGDPPPLVPERPRGEADRVDAKRAGSKCEPPSRTSSAP